MTRWVNTLLTKWLTLWITKSLLSVCSVLFSNTVNYQVRIASVINGWPSVTHLGNGNGRATKEILGEKPVISALRLPQIPHGLPSDRTRFSAVGGRQLPSWAAAWPRSLHDRLIRISCTVEQDGLTQFFFSVVVFERRTQVHIIFFSLI